MQNSDSKEQSSKVYIPTGTRDKESLCNQPKSIGTAHPINVLDKTPMGKIVKKVIWIKITFLLKKCRLWCTLHRRY